MDAYIESFLPLFVAINLPGLLPLFIGLTDGMSDRARQRLVVQALTTAFAVAALIVFAGQAIFALLGITVNDLRVAGGLILLILSITDLIFGNAKRRAPDEAEDASELGIVPLGIPLIVGPAAITTLLVSQQSHGYPPTLVALVINLVLVAGALFVGPGLMARLGQATTKAIAKVASLFLAAIAVAMIHAGILGMIAQA